MSFTNFLERKTLDHLFGRTTYVVPETLYFGASLGISEEGVVTSEPVIGDLNYSRTVIQNNTDTWANAITEGDIGKKTNAISIIYPMAMGTWGDISHFFVSDAPTGGNILIYGTLLAPKYVTAGDTLEFKPGDLIISMN